MLTLQASVETLKRRSHLSNRCDNPQQLYGARQKTLKSLSTSEQSIEQRVVEQIFEAVIDQRLPPGTKLSESALCEAFSVGRMHVRRSLLLLAGRELVEIVSNKGAFVASPTAKQARDVFEARHALEPTIARLAMRRAGPDDYTRLKHHVEQESAAHTRSDRREAIRLSGVFHVMLAEIADNGVLLRTTTELIARATLVMGMFGAPGMASCRDEDHDDMLRAFEQGNEDKVASLMTSHLNRIESNMNLDLPGNSVVDLPGMFANR